MALTAQGRRLTDVHRRRQVRWATAADSEIRRAWRLLDLSDIDAGRAAFQQRMLSVVQRYHGLSQSEAVAYLARYRLAEVGTRAGALAVPGLDYAATLDVIDGYGPRGLKHRIGQGVPPRLAYAQQQRLLMAETRKAILAGGRGVIRESGRADRRAIGWRRVSDGDPCTFCAMLVSRGPAYTSEAKALSKDGTDDPYHPNCGCTVEVVYGDWIPTEAEQVYVDAYFDAAEAANDAGEKRTADTVLWRMREDGTFRDSPSRRRVKRD